jgi:DMSO reductase anchor subunit
LKLSVELPIVRWLETEGDSPLHRTALLLNGQLGLLHRWRVACGVIGGILLPAIHALQMFTATAPQFFDVASVALIFVLCLVGEIIERHLFFVAVQPVKMPGATVA